MTSLSLDMAATPAAHEAHLPNEGDSGLEMAGAVGGATRQVSVALARMLHARGGPLDEVELWAVCAKISEAMAAAEAPPLITTDSVHLTASGASPTCAPAHLPGRAARVALHLDPVADLNNVMLVFPLESLLPMPCRARAMLCGAHSPAVPPPCPPSHARTRLRDMPRIPTVFSPFVVTAKSAQLSCQLIAPPGPFFFVQGTWSWFRRVLPPLPTRLNSTCHPSWGQR